VREWDPASAPKADIDAWLCLINDVLQVDLPDEPAWRSDHVREYLAVNMPEERRLMWFAEADGSAAEGGKVLGTAGLLLVGGQTGVLNLFVRADARRQGVARERP
jgi:hypothetical protein